MQSRKRTYTPESLAKFARDNCDLYSRESNPEQRAYWQIVERLVPVNYKMAEKLAIGFGDYSVRRAEMVAIEAIRKATLYDARAAGLVQLTQLLNGKAKDRLSHKRFMYDKSSGKRSVLAEKESRGRKRRVSKKRIQL